MNPRGDRHDFACSLPTLAMFLVVTTLAAACSPHADRTEPAATTEPSAADVESSSADAAVPDACTVFAAADLAATLGDPGEGTPAGEGTRTTCHYASGTIVGVSEASQYEPSVAIARQNTNCRDVSGVGDRAVFCDTAGVVGQLMWLKGSLMYDVSAGTVDEAAFTSLAARVR